MKILIIEDQQSLAKLIKKSLEKEGFAADYVLDGQAGKTRIELHHRDYDVVVLDLMLPKKSGAEVCNEIRAEGITIPILVLTAKDELENKVSLLNIGADDYLVKPFQFSELLARIRALARRPKQALPSSLSIRNIVLSPADKTVLQDGKKLKLTLTEFRLLEYFMRNPDQVIEREDLIGNAWDFNFDSFSNVVDVYINRLRKKLAKGVNKNLIETIRGVGYKINS